MNHDLDPLIGRIAPVTDARAAELLADDTAAELAGRITAASAAGADAPAAAPPRVRRGRALGLPLLAAGLAGAAVAVALAVRPGGSGVAEPPAPTRAAPARVELVAALEFTRKGRYLDVRIRDPYADPGRYRKEFAEHGLDVDLRLVPVSPSLVGTVVMTETSAGTRPDEVTPIRVEGACEVPSGGDDCTVGVRVRTGYEGSAKVVFGRAARPGEQYSSTARADAPGEAMHGMAFRGKSVSQVLAALEERNVTVPEYRVAGDGRPEDRPPERVPGGWYVHDAAPWADGQVLLFVGPEPPGHEKERSPWRAGMPEGAVTRDGS